jgi:hypothetical protein
MYHREREFVADRTLGLGWQFRVTSETADLGITL